ncbi:hypothetical protein PybrP1_007980 [[Pythium] brassicae (nom. inval.)]|nr:hypothetical protein PybrP1_007980 [[Pythium] brassicae (nom. inval.)]
MVRAWPLIAVLALAIPAIHAQPAGAAISHDFAELDAAKEMRAITQAPETVEFNPVDADGTGKQKAATSPTKAPASSARLTLSPAVTTQAPEIGSILGTASPAPTGAPKPTEKQIEKLITKLTLAPNATPKRRVDRPTADPTTAPPVTPKPTQKPSEKPSEKPTEKPSEKPTAPPVTPKPTEKPTSAPTPTTKPTTAPTAKPTVKTMAGPVVNGSTDGSKDAVVAPTTPKPSAKSTATPTATPSSPQKTAPHDCNSQTSGLLTKFYESNSALDSECRAANGGYRFPGDGAPTREQLINMGKTSACTILMQAVLQLVPSECDVKKVALRSTAEAVLQLAEDLKKSSSSAALPSADAITQAIALRRKKQLNIPSGESVVTETTKTPASASTSEATSWGITTKFAKKDSGADADGGDHVLLDDKLIVVGVWSGVKEEAGAETPVATATATAAPTAKPTVVSVEKESTPGLSSAGVSRSIGCGSWGAAAAAAALSLLLLAS